MSEPPSFLFNLVLAQADAAPAIGWVMVILKLSLVLFLVAANGFFVAAEFALVGVRRSRIETLAAAGNAAARRLLKQLNNLNAYLSASQLGITLASLGLGWVGEPVIARLLEQPLSGLTEGLRHGLSFAIAFSIITILHIVLGEQSPKLFGLARAEKVAVAVSLPMELFYRVFQWPIRALDWASDRTVRLVGLQPSPEHASSYTETELRQLIDISRDSGHLRAEERRLIHRVFEFSDTLVREAMVPRTAIAAIPTDCTLEELTKAFEQHRYSRLPVYRGSIDDVIGFVHSKDVMPYLLKPKTFRLEKVMQSPLFVVDTARLEDVLRQLQKEKTHFGFVVDEHGGLEGIITLEDLLEEIVGEISDEHDEEVNEQITPDGDRKYILAGGLAVRDLNRRLKLSLPESESYTTIAGFLMTEAGHVLKPGDTIEYNGLKFEVDRVERRRVISVGLELPSDPKIAETEITSNIARAAD
jgi:CBS domain containing-hemolysin-like protein